MAVVKKIRLLILIIFFAFLVIYFVIPKSYTKEYKIQDMIIKEKYLKNHNRYNITITYQDKNYDLNFTHKYLGKKIVKDVKVIDDCIIPTIKDIKEIPLCQDKYFTLKDSEELNNYLENYEESSKQIDNINIYNLVNHKYLIWNYNSFKYIDDKEIKDINIFNNDYYNISLAYKVNDYLVIPNYDNSYNFNEIIIININNLKKDIWKLNFDISFDSYILGSLDNTLYLVDKKNKVEYSLDIKNKKLKTIGNETTDGKIYNNNSLETISMNKLINNNLSFKYSLDQEYILEENTLYLKTLNNKILIKDNINKIIYSDNNYVYYLIDNDLYYFDYFKGNINNDNVIFIY